MDNYIFKSCKSLKYKAFSLIEMLMALLVASLLMTALAPVMIKKSDNKLHLSGTSAASDRGYEIFTYENCADPDGDGIAECSFTVPSGVYEMELSLMGAGGGGAGATSGVNETCKFNTVGGLTDGKMELCSISSLMKAQWQQSMLSFMHLTVPYGMQDLQAVLIGAGGGGGGAVGRMECNDSANMYLAPAQNGGVAACVNKHNAGDANAPRLNVAGVTVLPMGAGQNCTNEGFCCWQGQYPNTNVCGADLLGGGTYSGCHRSACQRFAAENVCNAYTPAENWRLPTTAEITAWAQNINEINTNQGDNGLQLCGPDGSTGGFPFCVDDLGSNCSGAPQGCITRHMWSSGMSGANYVSLRVGGGTISAWSGPDFRYAFSTRCISTNQNTYGNKSYSGSGGNSGAVFVLNKNEKINNYLASNVNGMMEIITAEGGNGALSVPIGSTSANSGASSSYASSLRFTTSSGNYIGDILYANVAFGGGAGRYGIQAAAAAGAGNCYVDTNKVNLLEGIDYSCSQGLKGLAGSLNSGGQGGRIDYSDFAQSGATGGSSNNAAFNGSNASTAAYGIGGGGAASTSSTNGKGGKGGDGYIQGSYLVKRQGSSGGGGGGGAKVYFKTISVTPGKIYKIKVGKGGTGGIGSSQDPVGKDGSLSSILIENTEIVAYGGKGGLKGNDDKLTPVSGVGGAGGSYKNASSVFKAGTKGQDGSYNSDLKYSFGGTGGASGTDAKGACGGLLEGGACVNANSLNGASIVPLYETLFLQLLAKGWADAGQGGGGGAWRNQTAGNGGNGTDGYVSLKWKSIGN